MRSLIRLARRSSQIEGIAHAAHVPALVLDADKQRSARGVGEGDDRLERAVRGGEVALELEDLALRALEQLDEVHALGSSLGSAGKHQPSGLATTNRPRTFTWLEVAYNERDETLVAARVEPEWDNLRSNPRFVAIARKTGVMPQKRGPPPEQPATDFRRGPGGR